MKWAKGIDSSGNFFHQTWRRSESRGRNGGEAERFIRVKGDIGLVSVIAAALPAGAPSFPQIPNSFQDRRQLVGNGSEILRLSEGEWRCRSSYRGSSRPWLHHKFQSAEGKNSPRLAFCPAECTPDSEKADDVVDPVHVIEALRRAEAPFPPGEVIRAHCVPVRRGENPHFCPRRV